MKRYNLYILGLIFTAFFWAALINPVEKSSDKTTQLNTEGFFTLDKIDVHWWFITPRGKPFFSIGLNHIDPASLRYPENIHIWDEKYKASTTEWLKKSVKPHLKEWGFNTMLISVSVNYFEITHIKICIC